MKRLVTIILSIALAACAPLPPPVQVPLSPPPARKIDQYPMVALVLGAGGAKGYAHLGVLSVLTKAGVPIELIAGASAGSIIGALYADQGNYQKIYKMAMAADIWSVLDISASNRLGFVSGFQLEKFIYDNIKAKNFRQLKIPLIIATTDLMSGKSYPIKSGPVAAAVRASASLPGLMVPPKMYGHTLIDGGVTTPIPVALVKPYHPRIIIAVDISSQLSPEPPIGALDVYHRAYSIMWNNLNVSSAQGADIFIHPQLIDTGTFSVDKKQAIFEAGRQAALKALPTIRLMMKKRSVPTIQQR